MKKTNVLLTSVGVASAINCIKSLRLSTEFEAAIVAVDCDELAPGLFLADYPALAPPIDEPDAYLDFLLSVCKQYDVNALFPCYSRELTLISEARDQFERLGVGLLLPLTKVIRLCDDKQSVSVLVKELGIPVPEFVEPAAGATLPVFSKLLSGSSSKGAMLVETDSLLIHLLQSQEPRLYQEYINGVEYTVDVLCDRNSSVLFAGPRKRLSTKSGQSVKGVTVHNDSLQTYVAQICSAVGMIGPCNVQFIERDGIFYFVEINPRFAAGGLMLTVHAGANLPVAALKLMLGLEVAEGELSHKEGVYMTRYWEEIITEAQVEA